MGLQRGRAVSSSAERMARRWSEYFRLFAITAEGNHHCMKKALMKTRLRGTPWIVVISCFSHSVVQAGGGSRPADQLCFGGSTLTLMILRIGQP
jgi:hypothetical protein